MMETMINWIPFSNSPNNIQVSDEKYYLIFTDRQDVRYVIYDGIYKNFYYVIGSEHTAISPRNVTHYAEINTPAKKETNSESYEKLSSLEFENSVLSKACEDQLKKIDQLEKYLITIGNLARNKENITLQEINRHIDDALESSE